MGPGLRESLVPPLLIWKLSDKLNEKNRQVQIVFLLAPPTKWNNLQMIRIRTQNGHLPRTTLDLCVVYQSLVCLSTELCLLIKMAPRTVHFDLRFKMY